jgi:iron complex outermembrane receptor protein
MNHRSPGLLIALLAFSLHSLAQSGARLTGSVKSHEGKPLAGVTASLLRTHDSTLVKITASRQDGFFGWEDIMPGSYFLSFTSVGFESLYAPLFTIAAGDTLVPLGAFTLKPSANSLAAVQVTARRPLVEYRTDRTIINVEAAITNVGATALEVLEKSPGVSVDRNGGISLKGREGVIVMVDGKPAQMTGAGLTTLLESMNASSIDQIELITQPSARYDAAGNAGIINIKTKKNRQSGWNGNVSLSAGQGKYPKTANSLNLNYRNRQYNAFMTYTINANRQFTSLYSDRTYYGPDEITPTAYFRQPAFLRSKSWNHNLKLGLDWFAGKNTTIGVQGSGFISPRTSINYSPGYWSNASGRLDSVVHTQSTASSRWENGALNLNLQQRFGKDKLLTADLDQLHYNFENLQYFENRVEPYNSTPATEDALQGDLPGNLTIRSARADYRHELRNMNWETGVKWGEVKADNKANYMLMESGIWRVDYDKTNHFVYREDIKAAYVQASGKIGKWNTEAGLRYEHTNYTGHQLGNMLKPDSSFSRSYGALFPTLMASFEVDSNHTFTVNAGRRIDRPAFQKLNPFFFFLNKYTYQQGNPFIRPQFTYNVELSHQYRNVLTTAVSYSYTDDYFSQLFYNRNGLIVYTEGNLATMRQLGLSVSTQVKPAKWWSLSFQGNFNYKEIRGVVVNDVQTASLSYVSFNASNQVTLPKGWSAELSGFYRGREQELQEVTFAFGQVSAGVAKQLWKNKATLRLSVRDIFYTGYTQGLTMFQRSEEYFRLQRDLRVATLAFNWRFGKAVRDTRKRSNGSAGEEIRRVGV